MRGTRGEALNAGKTLGVPQNCAQTQPRKNTYLVYRFVQNIVDVDPARGHRAKTTRRRKVNKICTRIVGQAMDAPQSKKSANPASLMSALSCQRRFRPIGGVFSALNFLYVFQPPKNYIFGRQTNVTSPVTSPRQRVRPTKNNRDFVRSRLAYTVSDNDHANNTITATLLCCVASFQLSKSLTTLTRRKHTHTHIQHASCIIHTSQQIRCTINRYHTANDMLKARPPPSLNHTRYAHPQPCPPCYKT